MRHLGLSDRKFWAVNPWYGFPRTACHAGAAALWGRRHVEAVVGCQGGTAITTGPYGIRRTPAGRLAFVDPHVRPAAHDDREWGAARKRFAWPRYAARQHARAHYALRYRGVRTARYAAIASYAADGYY